MIKTKSLFYEMRMRKTHVIVVYARIRTLHIANVLSLMASEVPGTAILIGGVKTLLKINFYF